MTAPTPREIELWRELEEKARFRDRYSGTANLPPAFIHWPRPMHDILADLDAERADPIPAGATPLDPRLEPLTPSRPFEQIRREIQALYAAKAAERVDAAFTRPVAFARQHNRQGPCLWCRRGDCPSMEMDPAPGEPERRTE